MAIKLIARGRKPHTDCPYEEYICDTEADIADLPKSCVGSTALVVESGRIYMVNASGEWKPFGEA